MTARIRRAGADDAALCHDLLCEMAAEAGGAFHGTPASLAAAAFGPAPLIHALLAEGDSGALGLLTCFAEYSTWRGEIGLFIQDIYLRPQARGQGLGRALIRAAWQTAPFRAGFISLMVAAENPGAIRFYQNLGFSPRGTGAPMILSGTALAAL